MPFSFTASSSPDSGASTPISLDRLGPDTTVTLALPAARGGILFLAH
jgi:hypothetical protein